MKLAVIILNWNGKNDTLACLESLKPQGTEIIVVDNGSTDDSIAAIREKFPDITLIPTGKNLGYAGGNNVGIEYALEKGADAILLLNNDTIPDRHFISALTTAAENSPEIGIFGAYPCHFSDPDKLDHLGGIWNHKTASFDLIGLGAPRGFRADSPLDYVCGCSILIRSAVFKAIGLLEPKFFLFWEEADFCWRARKAGFGIQVCYEAQLLHKVSASFTGGTPQKTYFWWRGRLLWIERNCSPQEKRLLYKTVIKPKLRHLMKLRILKTLQLFLRKNPQNQNKLLQYRAALTAYRDFSKGNFSNIAQK